MTGLLSLNVLIFNIINKVKSNYTHPLHFFIPNNLSSYISYIYSNKQKDVGKRKKKTKKKK